jgi:uncharacterized repeat protein (TIGR03843 family)
MPVLDRSAALTVLAEGEIGIVGRIVGSSNNALLVTVTGGGPGAPGSGGSGAPHGATQGDGATQGEVRVMHAVYKPTIGERPLDDFPDGTLTRREVAAWLVSEASGWGIVPPTVMREGPFGEGMVQAFIEVDPTVDVVAMVVEDDPRLRRMAAFDAAINNTDRKGGHILPVDGGRHVHGVDHGVCFSAVPKLRTVLWGWRGESMAADELDGLIRIREALDGTLGADLGELLSRTEVLASERRLDALLAAGRFPLPSPTWPAVPWPPF